ncbi:uncharacterized protein LOC123472449 [Daphnia magna]|uniref:uncharacterized protein LOC123472449 n=1 Tax=Daphnia magna TaxID=35525 RepID=UPI001E1BCB87|nr:uncharacterized protein LOC123472449 [Daphnia magna]
MGPTKVAKKNSPNKFKSPPKKSPIKKIKKSSRNWSEEEREQLIEAVKNYPCLYDTTCKTYKDLTVKTNAKVEISKLFESCSAEDVTLQWGTLVDKFRRTRKQYNNENPTGTSAEDSMSQYSHWDLYQSMLFLEKHIKQRTRFTNMSSATVRNLEASLEEISNDDTLNTNNDHLLLISTNDGGVITLESVSNSISQEESMDSFSESDYSLMMKDNRNDSPSNNDSTDTWTDSTRQREGEDIIRWKKTVNESVKPKSSTPTPSTSSSDFLPSFPESRTKRQRRLAESQSEKSITALVSQLISDKPPTTLIAEKNEKEVDEVTKEWRSYCKVYADKVAKIKSTSIKNDIRFNMEQMLYDAGKKEKEKAKKKKKKEEDRLNNVNT